ncbi:hypothetical protein [Pedobacter sp. SYSU D00535]|uniref:hypothetical protein n=1 Tax=Pedobacter sp. SYSU D00535 TaxID=2810308 RepID=UPI001A9589F5|nr:hypothetical protein [Pedobacter sp. SYSU D00535]
MITPEYITMFKGTDTYKKISSGVLEGHIKAVLIGEDGLGVSYSTEYSPTVPSQVLIGLHILLLERKISRDKISEVFKNIPVTSKNVLLILDYLRTYLKYIEDNDLIKLDYRSKLKEVIQSRDIFSSKPGFEELLNEIIRKAGNAEA